MDGSRSESAARSRQRGHTPVHTPGYPSFVRSPVRISKRGMKGIPCMRPLPAGCSEPRSFLQQKRRGCNKTPAAKSCGMISFFFCNNATKLQKRLVCHKENVERRALPGAGSAPRARKLCHLYDHPRGAVDLRRSSGAVAGARSPTACLESVTCTDEKNTVWQTGGPWAALPPERRSLAERAQLPGRPQCARESPAAWDGG